MSQWTNSISNYLSRNPEIEEEEFLQASGKDNFKSVRTGPQDKRDEITYRYKQLTSWYQLTAEPRDKERSQSQPVSSSIYRPRIRKSSFSQTQRLQPGMTLNMQHLHPRCSYPSSNLLLYITNWKCQSIKRSKVRLGAAFQLSRPWFHWEVQLIKAWPKRRSPVDERATELESRSVTLRERHQIL